MVVWFQKIDCLISLLTSLRSGWKNNPTFFFFITGRATWPWLLILFLIGFRCWWCLWWFKGNLLICHREKRLHAYLPYLTICLTLYLITNQLSRQQRSNGLLIDSVTRDENVRFIFRQRTIFYFLMCGSYNTQCKHFHSGTQKFNLNNVNLRTMVIEMKKYRMALITMWAYDWSDSKL